MLVNEEVEHPHVLNSPRNEYHQVYFSSDSEDDDFFYCNASTQDEIVND